MTAKYKLLVELHPDQHEFVKRYSTKCGIYKNEVIRRAIRALEEIETLQSAGHSIFTTLPDGTKQSLLFVF